MKQRSVFLGFAIVGVGSAIPLLAHAQAATSSATALEEVVITAERRTADVQKTGISVAVRDGDDLVKEGKFSLAQILEDVPGVLAIPILPGTSPNDNSAGAIVIRGVQPNTGTPTDSQVSTTALYVDGIYNGIGSDFDLERVEVLRGPQGTLYGRSATGGVVSIYSRDPELGTWGGNVDAEYGSYALKHASAAVNVPLGGTLALRVSGTDISQNGFLGAGGEHSESAGRIKLLYQPNTDFSLLLGLAMQTDHTDAGGPSATLPFGSPNTIAISPPFRPSAVASVADEFRQYWVKLNWNLGFGTLTYIPALRTFANDSGYALSFPFFTQDVTQDYKLDQIHTEELRLASNADSKVSWMVGAWYFDRKYKYDQDVTWQPSGGYSHGPHISKMTSNEALFGEATYPVNDTLRFTAGLRYDYTRIDSFGSTYTFNTNEGSCSGIFYGMGSTACSPFSTDFSLPNAIQQFVLPKSESVSTQSNVTFKLRMEKDLSSTNLLYAMVSSGFLPADLSIGTSGPTPQTQAIHAYDYESERLVSYEVGSKNRFFDNTLQLNGSVYYYNYSGYQTIINISGGGPAPNNVLTTSPARMAGAEIETLWQVTPNDRLGLSAGYVNAKFVDQPAFFATYVAQTKIPGIAPLTAQARYDHKFSLPNNSALNLGTDAFYTSGFDESAVSVLNRSLGAVPYVHTDSETIYNARATWTSPSSRYSVTGYVRNIADNVNKTRATVNGFGTDVSGNPTSVNTVVVPSEPRIYGVVLHAGF